jgi:plastocyanin
LLLALVVPVVAVVAVVVTLNVTSEAQTASSGPPGRTITIKDFAYAPTPLTVHAGATITVDNADRTAHTLTADDGRFDTRGLDAGAHATITIAAPGRYTYHCDIHPSMTGVVDAT